MHMIGIRWVIYNRGRGFEKFGLKGDIANKGLI